MSNENDDIILKQRLEEICTRCECCDTYWVECDYCGGEGGRDEEDLMAEDPLWYGPGDFEICDACDGTGGHYECLGHCDEEGKHKSKNDVV